MSYFWAPWGFKPRSEDPSAPRYADLTERAIAAAIDLWLLYTIFHPFFLWMQRQLYTHLDQQLLAASNETELLSDKWDLWWQAGLPQFWILNCSLQLLVIGVIIVGIQSIWYTTPGKWLLGLKIRRANTLEAPSRLQLIIRYLGYIPACLSFMIGMLWVSFNKQRRGWHDYLAGTVVIHTRPRGWYYQQLKRGVIWLKNRLRPVK